MQRCMCGLKSPIRSEIKLGKSGVRHYQESRQQQERTLLTSSCTGIRERIRNGDKHGERHSQDMRNDLSSRLEQSGSSPRQTYHSSITTRSYLVAPTRAPPCPWGQVTGWEKKLQRTADLLLLQRKIYIRLGITMLSAVMLLLFSCWKSTTCRLKSLSRFSFKTSAWLRARSSSHLAPRLGGCTSVESGSVGDLAWYCPNAALSCPLLGTQEGKKTQSCVLVSRGRKAGMQSGFFKVTQQVRWSLAEPPVS